MVDIEIGERGFAAALSVPDDALADTVLKHADDRLGGEDLRVAHDVFLDPLFGADIGKGEFQQEGEAVAGEERGAEAVGGRVRVFVSGELVRVFDAGEVGIGEDEVLGFRIFGGEKP